ncbi:apses-domain-containing protein [Rhizoclosmatium globosum]|uniref:Apses-domain-containing protein n=1 Tax=Rhizoclosmatium globosum TaxID=329046 RepID=A0A1Y2B4G4_9FUNG|nr:apses-domain-containing protein [Rhizoclosmatium globosum]|eukprot:ORY29732.1 apses-domain-containing protein [Rhizoclosmatium globosum]
MEPVVDDVVMEEASSSKSVESTPSLATTTAPSPPAIVLEKAVKKSAKKERLPAKKKEQLVPSASQPVVLNTYSKIEVWECNIKNIGLMRRVKDGWFNATQILKLAGYGEKAKRSKILEKMHLGIHEKVQGGFGRYQGTWIPRARALELAEEYNVVGLLKPMFECSESDTMIDMQLYTKPNKKENVEGAEIM